MASRAGRAAAVFTRTEGRAAVWHRRAEKDIWRCGLRPPARDGTCPLQCPLAQTRVSVAWAAGLAVLSPGLCPGKAVAVTPAQGAQSLPIPAGMGPRQGSKGKAVPPGVINGGIWAEAGCVVTGNTLAPFCLLKQL